MKNLFLTKSKKGIWGEKTNLAWTKIPSFFEMFPKGRVIHIVRDPRAVLSSWKKFTHAPGNDYLDSILNCYDSMKKGLFYRNNYTDKRYTLITYEDLVSDPVNTVKNICNALDIGFDMSMLETSNFTNLRGEKWKANSMHDNNMSGISISVVDKWKDILEGWEIILTENIIDGLLSEFNYSSVKINDKNEFVDKMINESQKSNLTSEGLIRFVLTNEGFERYPSDPLVKDNWG